MILWFLISSAKAPNPLDPAQKPQRQSPDLRPASGSKSLGWITARAQPLRVMRISLHHEPRRGLGSKKGPKDKRDVAPAARSMRQDLS